MARSEARLQFGMWRAGLNGFSAHAKLLYAVLLTEPTINHCGVGAIRLSRWAKDASLTIAETEKALSELTAGDPLVAPLLLDDDTDEVLVRTLIRNDGVADQPYVLKGALREAVRAQSPLIRWVLAAELRKLPPRQPDSVARNGRKVTYPDPHAVADQLAPEGSPRPPGSDSDDGATIDDGLFAVNPSERVSSDSSTAPETLHGGGGGGGGGGGSSPVATSVVRSAASSTPRPETPTKVAQRLAKAHYDRNPLTPFVAVMKLCKRALDAEYSEQAIADALTRLAAARRSVTADSLRIELDGPALRMVSGDTRYGRRHQPYVNPPESAYDEPMYPEEGR